MGQIVNNNPAKGVCKLSIDIAGQYRMVSFLYCLHFASPTHIRTFNRRGEEQRLPNGSHDPTRGRQAQNSGAGMCPCMHMLESGLIYPMCVCDIFHILTMRVPIVGGYVGSAWINSNAPRLFFRTFLFKHRASS